MRTKRPTKVQLLEPIIDQVTFTLEEQSTRVPRSFHASSIEDCGRKQWYGLRGFAPAPRMDHPEYIRDASAGNAIHEQYQNLLKASGNLLTLQQVLDITGWQRSDLPHDAPEIAIEMPLKTNQYLIGGRIDAIVNIDNTVFIVDIKTTKDKAFHELPSGYKYKKFYAQLQVYMHLTNIHQAIILAVNRNDSTMKEYVVEYDKDWCIDQFDRIHELKLLLDQNILPVAEPSWSNCSFCPFVAICLSDVGGVSKQVIEKVIV